MTCSGKELDLLDRVVATFEDGDVALVYLCPNPELMRELESDGPGNDGRYLLRLRSDSRPGAAVRFCDALRALIAFEGYGVVEGISPVPVADKLLKGPVIQRQELLSELLPEGPRSLEDLEYDQTLTRAIGIPRAYLMDIFRRIKAVYRSAEIFDACQFFALAVRDVIFNDYYAREAVEKPQWKAEGGEDSARMENSVLHCFKAVEALVGEPGKKDKLARRMQNIGIDPNTQAGFGMKRPIIGEIYWLQKLRDDCCGHGRKRRKEPLTYLEVFRAQQLAKALLHFAVQNNLSL